MVCRYCGLETGSGVGHQSQAECIQALTAEIDRARELVSRARDADLTARDGRIATPPGADHAHAT
ncbi:MAG: hypothetical protein H6Q10_2500 [Acidobacteria bacterium]|nr:hypothetical protein [Acidobacteriota bacterium]